MTLKASTKLFAKYFDYVDVFLPNLAIELSELIKINNYAIDFIEGKKPSNGLIYSLGLIELKTLKTYINTYLKTQFFYFFKFLANASIFFD